MSSEPKAVGYVSSHSLDELSKSDAGFLVVGIYRAVAERKCVPLYDEQALSALRAALALANADSAVEHKSVIALHAEVEALRLDSSRYRWLRDSAWMTPGVGPAVAVFDGDAKVVELDCSGEDLDSRIDAAMEQSA